MTATSTGPLTTGLSPLSISELTQRDQINLACNDPNLTVGERFIIQGEYSRLNTYDAALFKMLRTASKPQLERLELAYPDHVQAHRDWLDGSTLRDTLERLGYSRWLY